MPVTVTPRLRDGGQVVATGSVIVPKDDALELVIADPDPGGETFTLRLTFKRDKSEPAGFASVDIVEDRLDVVAVNFSGSSSIDPFQIATTEAGETVYFAFSAHGISEGARQIEYTVTVRRPAVAP